MGREGERDRDRDRDKERERRKERYWEIERDIFSLIMNSFKTICSFSFPGSLFMKFPVDELKWVNFLFVGMLVFFVFVFLFLHSIFLFSQIWRCSTERSYLFLQMGKLRRLAVYHLTVFVYKQWWKIAYVFKIRMTQKGKDLTLDIWRETIISEGKGEASCLA